MAVTPTLAVSGAALDGAVVRAPRPTSGGSGERRLGSERRPSPSLVFGHTGLPFAVPRNDPATRGGAPVGGGSRRRGVKRAVVPSRKVVVPEGENDGLTSSVDSARFQSDELEVPDIIEDQIESSETMRVAREADAESLNRKVLGSAPQEKPRTVPPTGDGQKIFQIDPMLNGYKYHLEYRLKHDGMGTESHHHPIRRKVLLQGKGACRMAGRSGCICWWLLVRDCGTRSSGIYWTKYDGNCWSRIVPGNGTMLMGLINGESPCVHDEVYPGAFEQKLRSHLGSFGVSRNLALQPYV